MAEWNVGAQLRSIRLDRGLTLEQLAEASGVSVRGVSDIERGIRERPRRASSEPAREQARPPRAEAPAESVQPHRVQDFADRDAEIRTISRPLGGPSQ